jgi:hypothetical protein
MHLKILVSCGYLNVSVLRHQVAYLADNIAEMVLSRFVVSLVRQEGR